MYLPDTEKKTVLKQRKVEIDDKCFKFETYEEDNPYYIGLLSGNNKAYVFGVQTAIETILEAFFDNLSIYEDELSPAERKSDLKPIMRLLSDNEDKASVLKECMLDFAMREKNEIVISCIESMDDEEYKKNYIKIFGEDSYNKHIGD